MNVQDVFKKPKKQKNKHRIEKRKADAELWADVKMVLIVIGCAIVGCGAVIGAIYFT